MNAARGWPLWRLAGTLAEVLGALASWLYAYAGDDRRILEHWE